MELSSEAIKDLRETLKQEIGSGHTDRMNDEDLSHIGSFLLEVFKQGLKRKMNLIVGSEMSISA
jgi:hypothetical protein